MSHLEFPLSCITRNLGADGSLIPILSSSTFADAAARSGALAVRFIRCTELYFGSPVLQVLCLDELELSRGEQ